MMHVIDDREFFQWLDNPATLGDIPDSWRQGLREKLTQVYRDEHSRPLIESAILDGYTFQEVPLEASELGSCNGFTKVIKLKSDITLETIVHEFGHAAAFSMYFNFIISNSHYMPDPLTENEFESYLLPMHGKDYYEIYGEKNFKIIPDIAHSVYRLLNTEKVWNLPPKELVVEQLAVLGELYFTVNALAETVKVQVIDSLNKFIPPQNGSSILDFFEQRILPGYVQANINREYGVGAENVVDQLISQLPIISRYKAKRIVTAQFLKHGNSSVLEFIKDVLAPTSSLYSKFFPSFSEPENLTFESAAADFYFSLPSILENFVYMLGFVTLTKKSQRSLQDYTGKTLKAIRISDEYKVFLIQKVHSLSNGQQIQTDGFTVEKLEALISPNAQKTYADKALTIDDLKDFDAAKINALTSQDAQHLYATKLITFNELKNFDAIKIEVLISMKLIKVEGNQQMIATKATSLLSKVISEGDVELLKELVQFGADKQIALTTAAFHGKENIVKMLVEDFGADVNKTDLEGLSVLAVAIVNNNLGVAKLLANQFGVDLNQKIYESYTPLTWLASQGKLDGVKELVKSGADVNKVDEGGRIALSEFLFKGDIDAVKELAKLGVDLNQSIKKGHGTYTPLTWLASEGKLDSIKELIKAGADISKEDTRGRTALSEFLLKGDMDSAQELVRLGADLNQSIQKEYNGYTPLTWLASQGKLDSIKELIKAGAPINKADKRGRTALSEFLYKDNIEAVKELAKLGADLNQDINNSTPLTWLAWDGKLDSVKELVKAGADINKQDSFSRTALSEFLFNGDIDAVKELVKLGADLNQKIKKDYRTYTPLTWLASQGKLDSVKELVKIGADVNKADGEGRIALSEFLFSGDIDAVKELVKLGADLNQKIKKDYRDYTPLTWLASEGKLDGVKELIKAGADISNDDERGRTALSEFLFKGDMDSVQELVKLGADLRQAIQKDYRDYTPLTWLASEGKLDSVKELVKAGADINKVDNYGRTALSGFLFKGDMDSVQELVKLGADLNQDIRKDYRHYTPLTWLASQGKLDSIKELIKAGADINKPDKGGGTALSGFIFKDDIDSVQELVRLGADLNQRIQKDYNYYTPLTWFASQGRLDRVKELIKAGADINKEDGRGITALSGFVFKDDIDSVQELVILGADINQRIQKDYRERSHCTPLTWLASQGKLNSIKKLIKAGADINKADEGGRTALSGFLFKDDIESVQELVKLGADLHQDISKDYRPYTPLTWLASQGKLDSIKELIKAGADINKPDKGGGTALSGFIFKDDIDSVQELVRLGADLNQRIQKDYNYYTPLTWFASQGRLAGVKELIKIGADINKADEGGRTALSEFLFKDDADAVKELASLGADLNQNIRKDYFKLYTPLTWFASQGRLDVVKELIKAGADINKADQGGRTALSEFVFMDDIDSAQELVRLGANINQKVKKDYISYTPLSWLTSKGKLDAVKELENVKNEVDAGNRTRLLEALFKDDIETVKKLAKLGADLNQDIEKDDEFYTPLTWLASEGKLDSIKELVKAGASANIKDAYGKTVLSEFLFKDNIDAVKELAMLGADLNRNIRSGFKNYTPLTWLASRMKLDSIKELVKVGADINKADSDNNTVLSVFVSRDKINEVKELIHFGNETNKPIIFGHILILAETQEMAEFLIKEGAILTKEDLYKKHSSDNQYGLSAEQLEGVYERVKGDHVFTKTECVSKFILAAAKGDLKSLDELGAKLGASIIESNEKGWNALTAAVYYGQGQVVDKLVKELHMDVNKADGKGDTAAAIAALPCNKDVLNIVGEHKLIDKHSGDGV